MSKIILTAQNISKQYRLGVVGTGTLSHDLNRWWASVRGKDDPYLKIGAENDRSKKAETDYVWALRDINFDVHDGDVLGIIGKNGAGKSTLLKILSRVTSPTTGSIKTKGRIASLLEVGTGFHPELTGRENIYLNGAILGMTKAEIKVKEEEIIDFSGCAMYIDTPVKRYSSGMRVRLAFAVAAHLEPDILVVDEVLAVGDAEFQKKAIGKMKDISGNDGRTVLFVSHNMAAVKSLCTRGIVLENGTSTFEGTAEESVDYYLSKDLKNDNLPIKERTDRTGNGKVKLINASLINKNGSRIESVISGEFLRVQLNVKVYEEVKSKFIIGLAIFDSNEVLKSMIVTDEIDVDMNTYLKRGHINIDIPSFDLRGGNYYLRVVLSEGSTNKPDQLDNIDKALEINVLPGDLYGIGRQNRSYNCSILRCEIN
ncbi:ABC transporter ATP-binding protein [Psychroflexus montanilacus]|uniref:ABC transporter ATP-binding protein n=1 Tax=Psychroflexus montanilacus TaxID=2873598 RepID=UPI001CC903A2|nr:ABC transporter ATP-binding protein [Psychroflexus montanilacus]MBZ9652114.1 ABC transporter ATP-binding protein [Psychroflexus montanilacus]